MKRKGNIYEKITDLNNIETAIYRASKGKGNRKSVEKILDSPILCYASTTSFNK